MNKRNAVVALIGLNLFLLAALILSSYSPPEALAQARGRPGDFVIASVQMHTDIEEVAIINIQTSQMFFFVPRETAGGTPKLQYAGFRDLKRDFGR